MRTLNIVRLSVATIIPFGLLVTNGADGKARNSQSPDSTQPNVSNDRAKQAPPPAAASQPKNIAAPEVVPVTPAPSIVQANSLPVVQVPKHPHLSQTLSIAKAPIATNRIAPSSRPENLNFSWDSIIERSAGIRLAPTISLKKATESATTTTSSEESSAQKTSAETTAETVTTPAPIAPEPIAEAAPEAAPEPKAEVTPETAPEPAVESAAATTPEVATAPAPIEESSADTIATSELTQNETNEAPAVGEATSDTAIAAQANPASSVAPATPAVAESAETPTTEQTQTAISNATAPSLPSEPEMASAPIAPVLTALNPTIPSPETSAPIQSAQVRPFNSTSSVATPVNTAVTRSAVLAQTNLSQVDERYALGPGDTLRIDVFNVPEYSGEYRVLADGSLNLPVVGSVPIAGQTLQQAQETIAAQYSRELRNIRITVSLLNARPLQVGVVGEVGQPGLYTLGLTGNSQFPTVAQAIQTAGGATQSADLREVVIRRTRGATPQEIKVNLWELLQNGDLSQNLALRDGDTVMVRPRAEIDLAETSQLAASNLATNTAEVVDIALVGEVARPGAYKLGAEGATSRPTLTEAIQAAGGITSLADIRQVQVRRQTRSGTEQTFKVDLWQVVQAGDLNQDVILQRGDRIVIPTAQALTREESVRLAASNIAPSQIRVSVVGEVEKAGTIEIPSGSTLNQALLSAGGLNRRGRRTVALIRLNPNGSLTRQEIKVDLRDGSNEAANPLLQNNDIVVVGRTGFASFSDTLSDVLNPLFRLLPLTGLF